jgi:hypothetical protein
MLKGDFHAINFNPSNFFFVARFWTFQWFCIKYTNWLEKLCTKFKQTGKALIFVCYMEKRIRRCEIQIQINIRNDAKVMKCLSYKSIVFEFSINWNFPDKFSIFKQCKFVPFHKKFVESLRIFKQTKTRKE